MRKRSVIIICLLLSLLLMSCGSKNSNKADSISSASPTNEPASQTSPAKENTEKNQESDKNEKSVEAAYFEKNDILIDGLKFGMAPEEVIAVLGEPKTQESSSTDDYIYGEYLEFDYNELVLLFSSLKEGDNPVLVDINVKDQSIILSNGLHVGVKAQEVIDCYKHDFTLGEKALGGEQPWGYMLYGSYLYTSDQGYELPKKHEHSAFYSVPNDTTGEYYITYACYEPYDSGYAETSVSFYIDGSNLVKNIIWEYNQFK